MNQKIIIYIHITSSDNYLDTIQRFKLSENGLFTAAKDVIFSINGSNDNVVTVTGIMENATIINRPLNYSQFPTLVLVKKSCDHLSENHKILYLHAPADKNKEFTVLNKWQDCIKDLDKFDTCGQYQMNFWWANSDYIKTLSYPEDNAIMTLTWIYSRHGSIHKSLEQ